MLGRDGADRAATRLRRALRQGDAAAHRAHPDAPDGPRDRRAPDPGGRRAGPGHPPRRALRPRRARSSSTAGRFPTPGPVATLLLACYQATVADIPPRLARPGATWSRCSMPARPRPDEVIAAAARWQATAVRGRGGAPRGRAARPGLRSRGCARPSGQLGRVHDARPSLADAAGRPSASGVRVLAPAGRRRRPVGLAGPTPATCWRSCHPSARTCPSADGAGRTTCVGRGERSPVRRATGWWARHDASVNTWADSTDLANAVEPSRPPTVRDQAVTLMMMK